MNTRRNASRIVEEGIANMGAPLRGDQVAPFDEDMIDNQALVNPSLLTDGDIRDAFLHMAQYITTTAQSNTTQSQAMIA